MPIEYRLKNVSWEIIDKLLESNEDLMCSISYENIELTDEYCRCLTCKNIYKADVLITWVTNGHRNKYVRCVEHFGQNQIISNIVINK